MFREKERKEANAVYRCRHIKWSAGKQRPPSPTRLPTPPPNPHITDGIKADGHVPFHLTDDEVLFCEAPGPARLDKH